MTDLGVDVIQPPPSGIIRAYSCLCPFSIHCLTCQSCPYGVSCLTLGRISTRVFGGLLFYIYTSILHLHHFIISLHYTSIT